MNYWLILIPLISAFIGWFTNWIAIKMLFHPKEPKKILMVFFPKDNNSLLKNWVNLSVTSFCLSKKLKKKSPIRRTSPK